MHNKRAIPDHNNGKPYLWLGTCLLLSFTLNTPAATPVQAIHIQADYVDIQQRQGISKYRGHVELTQGRLKLQADELTIYQSEKGIKRISAQGLPIKFNQTPEPGQAGVRGQAHKIEYQADKGQIEFIEEAQLWKGNDQFSGAHIIYDMEKKQVKASGDSGDESPPVRVKAILHPQHDKEQLPAINSPELVIKP